MRRILALFLCLVLTAVSGCAGKTGITGTPLGTETAVETTEAPRVGTSVGNGELVLTDDPVELTFWLPVEDPNDADEMADWAWDEIISDFEAQYPQVTIKLTGVGSDLTAAASAWNAAAATDSFPELFYAVDNDLASWAGESAVVDCSPYLSDAFVSAYSGTALETANAFAPAEGAIYLSPCSQEAEGWIFNTEILGAYDLTIPTTWDEMLNVCTVLQENGVTPICQGGADSWAIWGYHEFCNQYGWTEEQCEKFTEGKLAAKDTAFYDQFRRIAELAAAGAFASDVASVTNDEACEAYLSGEGAALQIYDGWRYDQMQLCLSDPDGNSTTYNTLMNSQFTYGFDFSDDLFSEGDVNGIKMNNWGVYVGACAENDPQKLAACVAFLEFFVSQKEYSRWSDVASSIPLKWGTDGAYSVFTLEQSYQKAYSEEGTFFHDPTDWFTVSITDEYDEAVTGLIDGTLDVDGACALLDAWQAANAAS